MDAPPNAMDSTPSLTVVLHTPKIAAAVGPSFARSPIMDQQNQNTVSRGLLRVIATDIHFWIPLAVLVAGLLLLNKLR